MNITKLNHLFRYRLAPTITEVYGQAVNRRVENLTKFVLEKSNRAAQSDLAQKLRVAKRYYSAEMKMPSGGDDLKTIKEDVKLVQDFFKEGCYKYLTVKQAFLLFLVSTEVGLWFFLGETIGKMHIVGYKV